MAENETGRFKLPPKPKSTIDAVTQDGKVVISCSMCGFSQSKSLAEAGSVVKFMQDYMVQHKRKKVQSPAGKMVACKGKK